jgi:hypothetical protein
MCDKDESKGHCVQWTRPANKVFEGLGILGLEHSSHTVSRVLRSVHTAYYHSSLSQTFAFLPGQLGKK